MSIKEHAEDFAISFLTSAGASSIMLGMPDAAKLVFGVPSGFVICNASKNFFTTFAGVVTGTATAILISHSLATQQPEAPSVPEKPSAPLSITVTTGQTVGPVYRGVNIPAGLKIG